MKANFRIVCLKNDDSRKYNDQKIKNNGNIVLLNNSRSKIDEDILTPNLVHLSARLQDDAFEYNNSQNKLSKHVDGVRPHVSMHIPQLQEPNNLISSKDQLQFKKYFKNKELDLQKEKNTMKNLIGSVNFTPNRKVEKKISRLIKETIKDVCVAQKNYKKKHQQQSQAYSITPNRSQLNEDFHNFLTNKSNEKYKKFESKQEDKILKLSIINPERLQDEKKQSSAHNLNLFRFLHQQYPRSNVSSCQRSRVNNISSLRAQRNIIKSRVEKKLFNLHPSLKTQEEEFEWSRIKRDTKKNHSFAFKTLD